MFPMRAHNRIMNKNLLLSNITEKHNYPKYGYKQNKYGLPHHGTIVNKRCWLDSYRNSRGLRKNKTFVIVAKDT